jgi:endoglycosylceramidase
MCRLPLCTVISTLALASIAGSASAAPLAHNGRWLTDAHGRVVVLHGAEIAESDPAAAGIGTDDARQLAALGFDVARLGLSYARLEPSPGQIDRAYLQRYLGTAHTLEAAGLRVIVELHQTLLNERFEGRGFPDWAVQDDGVPAAPQAGYPQNYLVNAGLNRAFDNLFANAPAVDGVGLVDHVAAAWRAVAARLAGDDRVVGYELLFQPWPGSRWATCGPPAGCPAGGFDSIELTRFDATVASAIRTVDRRHLLFYEPSLTFVSGALSHVGVPDARSVFAFPVACLAALATPDADCTASDNVELRNAEQQAAQNGSALMMTDWGGNNSTPASIAATAARADAARVSWAFFAYHDEDASPTDLIRDPRRPPTAPGNAELPLMRSVARAYPLAVAGRPSSWSFDPSSRAFDLRFAARRGGTTKIATPRFAYSDG